MREERGNLDLLTASTPSKEMISSKFSNPSPDSTVTVKIILQNKSRPNEKRTKKTNTLWNDSDVLV
jgi:hypothetical protein